MLKVAHPSGDYTNNTDESSDTVGGGSTGILLNSSSGQLMGSPQLRSGNRRTKIDHVITALKVSDHVVTGSVFGNSTKKIPRKKGANKSPLFGGTTLLKRTLVDC